MFKYFTSVEVFDTNYPAAWTRGPEFPTPLSEPHAFVYRDTLYVIGGHGPNYAHNTNVYSLARSGKEWTIVQGVHVDHPLHDIHPAPLIQQDTLHCKQQQISIDWMFQKREKINDELKNTKVWSSPKQTQMTYNIVSFYYHQCALDMKC